LISAKIRQSPTNGFASFIISQLGLSFCGIMGIPRVIGIVKLPLVSLLLFLKGICFRGSALEKGAWVMGRWGG
jgi:hypothetical protein